MLLNRFFMVIVVEGLHFTFKKTKSDFHLMPSNYDIGQLTENRALSININYTKHNKSICKQNICIFVKTKTCRFPFE